MERHEIVEYYSREEVIENLINNARNREVAGAFFNGSYTKRPGILQFKSDVKNLVNNNTVSFHYSAELWSNPMSIERDQAVYDALRIGWDLIIDIDSKIDIEESQITANMISNFLKKKGIRNHGVKFSGRRGFHIALPSIMFPKKINYKDISLEYPRIPRIISSYIRESISEDLMKILMNRKKVKEFIGDSEQKNPYYIVEVEKNWGNRHMFRAPYSLNEKTWLVSVPINNTDIESFSTQLAKPENIKFKEFFKGEDNEAEQLLSDALDWDSENRKDIPKLKVKTIKYGKKIHEKNFPPCMKIAFQGLTDGKKRMMFVLINFLRACNWDWEEITRKMIEWNRLNKSPLQENLILGQIKRSQKDLMNTPSCDNSMYYADIGICRPDRVCKGGTDKINVKNPMNYVFRKLKVQKKLSSSKYSCRRCKKEFETWKKLDSHKSRVHEDYD